MNEIKIYIYASYIVVLFVNMENNNFIIVFEIAAKVG